MSSKASKRFSPRSRSLFSGALLAAAPFFAACGGLPGEGEPIASVEQLDVPPETNGVSAAAIDTKPLRYSVLDSFGLYLSGGAFAPLCDPAVGTVKTCTLTEDWNDWRIADVTHRNEILNAMIKCGLDEDQTIEAFDGKGNLQWRAHGGSALATSIQTQPIETQHQEYLSSCILALVNANHVTVSVCLITDQYPSAGVCPGGPAAWSYQEAVFAGQLFFEQPEAFAAGGSQEVNGVYTPVHQIGRICGSGPSSQGLCGSIRPLGKAHDDPPIPGACQQWDTTIDGFEFCRELVGSLDPNTPYLAPVTTYLQ